MNNKKYISTFFLSILIISGLFLVILFLYDPLHIYRLESNKLHTKRSEICSNDPTLTEEVPCQSLNFLQQMRYQAAWIINNVDFDGIMFWTSILRNNSSKEAWEALWWEFINISAWSSTLFERKMILEYAMSKKDVSNVVLTIDNNIINHAESFKKSPIENFKILYDSNPFNDIKMYLNKKYLKCALSRSMSSECIGELKNIDRPNTWHNDKELNEKFWWLENRSTDFIERYITQNYERTLKPRELFANNAQSKKKLNLVKKYLNDNIVSLAKENPDTTFHLIFPPYSSFYYGLMKEKWNIEWRVHLESLKYLLNRTNDLDNVKVYAFGLEKFPDDIWNYLDLIHFNHEYNSYIMKSIGEWKHILSMDNIDDYISKFSEKIEKYDVQWVLSEAEEILLKRSISKNLLKRNDSL